jgi:hypothetical protein
MTKKRRLIAGAESVEIALISVIALAFGIGAFLLFGEQIQKVFQNENSPMLMAAKMKDSADSTDPTATGARTNLDKNLTAAAISKSYADKSIGSEIGLETTGAAGGDAQIGGTYIVDDPTALVDGDPKTTGNALLDAALAAKKSAENLVNKASNAVDQAGNLLNVLATLDEKLIKEGTFLTSLNDNLVALKDQLDMLTTNIDVLVEFKAASAGLTATLTDSLTYLDGINSSIVEATNNNTTIGNDLLTTNQEYLDAVTAYEDLKSDYEAGITTTCDASDPPVCVEENLSGITEEEVLAAEAQAQLLQDSIAGSKTAIQDDIAALAETVEGLADDAEEAGEAADDLLKDARDTVKEAFYKKNEFDGLSIAEMITLAQDRLVNNDGIKNKEAAEKAISLLDSALKAYTDWQILEAEVSAQQTSLDQLNDILAAIEAGAETVTFEASGINTDTFVSTNNATLDFMLNSDAAITGLTEQATSLDAAIIKVMQMIDSQTAYITNLETQIDSTTVEATNSDTAAGVLVVEANNAVTEAQNVIDTIVTYPDP